MVWSETGELKEGVLFEASETQNASRTNKNSRISSRANNPFRFKDNSAKGQESNLTICADDSIPNQIESIGVGMGGKPAIAVEANMKYQFKPHPTYWAVFGDYEEGRVIDVNNMSNAMEIRFPSNIHKKSLVFTKDNEWK